MKGNGFEFDGIVIKTRKATEKKMDRYLLNTIYILNKLHARDLGRCQFIFNLIFIRSACWMVD